jgi:beta-lactamase regulating signal transducer with metallopeptidase domain
MIDLLAGRPGQLLAETLLHFLWQGAALVLLLKLSEPLLRSVQHRYAASLGTLVVMLVLPLATYYALTNRDVAKSASALADVEAMDAVMSDQMGIAPVPVLTRLQPLFVGLWLVGVLLLAARLLVGYAATLWLRGDRKPLPAELALKVAWLGRRLGVATRCRVFLSSRIDEAIAVGCFKPLVLIPLAWATELPPSALEAVIAHELAHIRRWDLWATLLQRLAETLLFYHPAVWWLSRRLSQQRELCCDALAVSATRSPADYVLALETIARRTSAPPLTLATSFLGGGNMNLLDRVRHVLKGEAREASAWWPAGLAALVAPLLAAVALGGWSLLPATVVADEERDEPAEARAEEDPTEAGDYLGLVVRLLEAGDEDGAEEDGADEDDAEEAARQRKREVVREREALRELRVAEEALARVAKKAEESNEDAAPAKKKDPKKPSDDFNLSDFKPQTEREARLLAVIKRLQSQVKGASGSSNKKGLPGSKDAKARSEYEEFSKVFSKKLEEDDEAYKRAISEKEAILAKERAGKELKEKDDYQRALKEKEAILHKERAAKELEGKEEYQRALKEKEAILAKERAAKDRDAKFLRDGDEDGVKQPKRKTIELDARLRKEKEGKKPMISEKDAALRKQKEDAAAEKEAWYRKLKDGKGAGDEVEALRRALREREAQLQKAQEALERARKDASDLDRYRKDGDRKEDPKPKENELKDGDRKDKEEQARNDANAFDEYIRLRLKSAEFKADKDPSERGR